MTLLLGAHHIADNGKQWPSQAALTSIDSAKKNSGHLDFGHQKCDHFPDIPSDHGLPNDWASAGDYVKMLSKRPALVLNADFRPLSYFPLSLWSWQDTIRAVVSERVTVLAHYDVKVRAQRQSIQLPSVISLKDYVRQDRHPVFTRFNLFLRDGFACQYCGATGELTFDHVVPRAMGGETSWTNIITACAPCNFKKGGRSLAKSGLQLKTAPKQPSLQHLQAMGRRFPPNHLHESWLDWLYWDLELASG